MSDQLNAGATSETAQTWKTYTPSTHTVNPTRRIRNYDYGDLGGLNFPDICLTGEEKPRKNLTQETCPDRGSNPGPLRDKRACYHLLHSGGLETVVTVKNTNDIREEIKRRINMGNACYYSLEKILSSHLLSKLIHIKLLHYRLYCMVVKLGLSRWERSKS